MDPLSKPMQYNWKYTRSLLDIALSRVPTDRMVGTDARVHTCTHSHRFHGMFTVDENLAVLQNGILCV